MTSVTLARRLARRLVDSEARRTSTTTKQAIASVARRLRAPHGTIWGLLFRLPKQINADLLKTLEAAVEREIKREIGALEDELATLRSGTRRIDPGTLEEVEAGLVRLRAILREGRHDG